MIQKQDIKHLINLLVQRRVVLFHACQFLDFQSYLSLGGIPSRACLENNGLPFTKFETDEDDHSKDVWDKIFMNFSDFGTTFAKGGNGVPNPYGPILLKIDPEALNDAEDIAVCIQPVGSSRFINSKINSLKTISDIDRIFVHPIGHPKSDWVKFRENLQKEFGYPNPSDPDISCTEITGKLSLKYVTNILVDPYRVSGKPLRDHIVEITPPKAHRFIQERYSRRKHLYNELISFIINDDLSISTLSQNPYISEELSRWAQVVEEKGLGYQFKRFADYLREGTLLKIPN